MQPLLLLHLMLLAPPLPIFCMFGFESHPKCFLALLSLLLVLIP
jgi:hypothetical protein